MTGAVFELQWNDQPLRDAARRLTTFSDTRAIPMWHAIGHSLVSYSMLRFDEQHDPRGAPWEPSQRARKDGGQTLIWKGLLLASLTYNVLGNNGVEHGSNRVYAAAMQFGADITIYSRGQKIYRNKKKVDEAKKSDTKWLLNDKGEKVRVDLSSYQFTKARLKSSFASWVVVPEYHIRIIPRPYLGMSAENADDIIAIALRHEQAALLGDRP